MFLLYIINFKIRACTHYVQWHRCHWEGGGGGGAQPPPPTIHLFLFLCGCKKKLFWLANKPYLILAPLPMTMKINLNRVVSKVYTEEHYGSETSDQKSSWRKCLVANCPYQSKIKEFRKIDPILTRACPVVCLHQCCLFFVHDLRWCDFMEQRFAHGPGVCRRWAQPCWRWPLTSTMPFLILTQARCNIIAGNVRLEESQYGVGMALTSLWAFWCCAALVAMIVDIQ